MSENVSEKAALGKISEYIEKLKFKGAVVGGVDKEDVFVAIREIYHLFSEAYGELEGQLDAERKRADGAELAAQAQAQEAVDELKQKTASVIADAERQAEQKSKTQIAAMERQNRAQLAELERRLETAKNTVDGDALQKTVERYESQLSALRRQSGERENELRQRLEAEQAAARKAETELSAQVKTLQGQLALNEAELTRKDSEHARELELAKSSTAARGETLEEIYIEARAAREKALTKAREEADALRADTERELAALRSEVQGETEEARRKNELAIAGAQAQAEQLLADAQQTVADASEKAVEIVAVARQDYQREREKYNAHLLKLGTLRAGTVSDIQNAVSRLSALVFEMSGLGIQSNTVNDVELSQIDEAVAAMEAEAESETEVVENGDAPDIE